MAKACVAAEPRMTNIEKLDAETMEKTDVVTREVATEFAKWAGWEGKLKMPPEGTTWSITQLAQKNGDPINAQEIENLCTRESIDIRELTHKPQRLAATILHWISEGMAVD